MSNTWDVLNARIAAKWSNRPLRVDFHGLETILRQILREYRLSRGNANAVLQMMDDAIAAWTGRGNELEQGG